MESLPAGTVLHILVNPNSNMIVEIKTDAGELLNFETAQEKIDSYHNGYIVLGVIACTCGVLLIAITVAEMLHKKQRKKAKENNKRCTNTSENGEEEVSPVLRYADLSVKSRILLEAPCRYVRHMLAPGKISQ